MLGRLGGGVEREADARAVGAAVGHGEQIAGAFVLGDVQRRAEPLACSVIDRPVCTMNWC
jgi:hypothetical protein